MTTRSKWMAAIVSMTAIGLATSAMAQTHERAPGHAVVPSGNILKKPPAADNLSTPYKFTLNSFRITDTRALHNDTDFVSISVAVGNNPPITVPVKAMGDVNNGTHQVNISIPNVMVAPGQKVAFSYAIVNTGHDADSFEKALLPVVASAAQKAVVKAVVAAGGEVGVDPGTATTIGTFAGSWLGPKIANIIFANCDGSVAAGDHVFTGAQLLKQTAGGHLVSGTDDNKGTDSPTGCGSNSRYYVTWSVSGPAQNSSSSRPVGSGGGNHGSETGRHQLQ
jgi:hypothetical protein